MAEPTFQELQRDFERLRAQFVLTELELASTFLDLAAVTGSPDHYQRYLHDAETAVRTADRFMQNCFAFTEAENAYIGALRQQLRERLRVFSAVQKKRARH